MAAGFFPIPTLAVSPVFIFIYAIVALVAARKINRSIQKRRFARANGCLPTRQEPRKDPFFSLDLLNESVRAANEHRFLDIVAAKFPRYGNTYSSHTLHLPEYRTIDPENVQTILALKFKDFGFGNVRLNSFGPLLGHGIFTADGAQWEHSRALVRPNFVRNQISDIQVYESHLRNLVAQIPKDGSTVDLQALFFRLTLDSATEFLFGESVNSLRPDSTAMARKFADDFNYAQDILAFRFKINPVVGLHRNAKFKQVARDCRIFVDQFVEKALAYRAALDSGEKSAQDDSRAYVFLYELSKKTTDKKELNDQLMNILLAGRDTTASLLGMVFYLLARRPDVWNKLRAEVAELNGQYPSFEQLKAMKYLTWVMNETLRLYPIVPLNGRVAVRDTFLPVGGGPDGKAPVFVAKGQLVTYSVHAMHRRRDVYGADADDFRPERWENLKPGWAYLPFNGGPRICIGQQFALTEAGYTIVRLLQHFKAIDNRDPLPWEENLTLTCCSLHGTQVSLTPA